MTSDDDDDDFRAKSIRPKQQIIPPGADRKFAPIPTPPAGVIEHAFFTAIHYRMQGRAVAAYREAVREVVSAVVALRDLDYAVADRKLAQVTLDNFDELIAEPHLNRLRANAADAQRERVKAEDDLDEAKLEITQRRAVVMVSMSLAGIFPSQIGRL